MDFRLMTPEEFQTHCIKHGLTNDEIEIADLVLRKQMKGAKLYLNCDWSPASIWRKRKSALEKLDKQLIKV